MNLRRLLLLVLALATPLAARAQFTVYGTFAPVRVSGLATGPTAYNASSFWANGFGAGFSSSFLPTPVVSLASDFRFTTRPGTNGADTYMGGLKLGAKAPKIPFKPYIEGAGGVVRVRGRSTAGSNTTNNYVGYEILGGVDHPIGPLIDWRIVELGGGKAYPLSTAPDSNISLFTIQTGLTVHF